ncbi:MAG: Flagellar hook-length control protein [Proteobacteria bacterium]|nr:Flagellar hook-length control protein [Pseudomonadota bacterium]
MSVSVISNVASAMGLATPAAAPEGIEGLAGDFAALLSGQTLAAMMTLADSDTAKNLANQGNSKDSGVKSEKAADDNSNLPFDPAALVAMIGNPQLQPAIPITPQAIGEVLKPSQDKDLALAISAQLSGQPRERSSTALTEAAITPAEYKLPLNLSEREAPAGKLASDAANIAASSETINFNASLSAALQPKGSSSEHQLTVNTPLHAEAWPKQFGEKIVWLAKNDQQTAQININPPQLGPVQITLNLNGDHATALFSSQNAEVRQAIEASLPQLKEMLSAAGISLGDTNVGANLAQQNQNNPFLAPNKNQSMPENAILPANDNTPNTGIAQVLHKGRGLVDLFA